MKRTIKLALVLTLLASLFLPQIALAQGPQGDKLVLGGSYTLQSGESLNGNLVVLGGSVDLQENSNLNGNVLLAGGSLQVGGKVTGNILATGGSVNLAGSAVVSGDISTLGATLNRAPGAQVFGNINNGFSGPAEITVPGAVQVPNAILHTEVNIIVQTFLFFLRAFLWAALAILVVLFLPRHVEQVAQAAVVQPLISAGLGVLTAVILPLVLLLVAITIIGIPVSLLGVLALVVTWAFGIVVLGLEVGKRLAQMLKVDLAAPVMAGAGTFILILVMNGIKVAIPCIGWIFTALVGCLGLGAVLLTRYGTQPYLPAGPQTMVPVDRDWTSGPPMPPTPPTPPTAAGQDQPPVV
jgi:cytoskeletal protein CcmA (bactofilin family)